MFNFFVKQQQQNQIISLLRLRKLSIKVILTGLFNDLDKFAGELSLKGSLLDKGPSNFVASNKLALFFTFYLSWSVVDSL